MSFLAALRAQFLIECLADLRKNLTKKGLNLLIQQGKPEEILPTLAKTYGAHTVKWFPDSFGFMGFVMIFVMSF